MGRISKRGTSQNNEERSHMNVQDYSMYQRSLLSAQQSSSTYPQDALYALIDTVECAGKKLYRDFAWRNTHDPYGIWISEVMLQQTQTSRVEQRWDIWMKEFPTVDILAQVSVADVLRAWQGMGYNRRALHLLSCAQEISAKGGVFPRDTLELQKLPGIGPATAAGICAFAFNQHAVYLETNVRSVLLHHLFVGEEDVSDRELRHFVDILCPDTADMLSRDIRSPRMWYYALLDYGVWLKQHVPNPSRRSRTYKKQTKFEGSHRQKRAALVRMLLERASYERGVSAEELSHDLSIEELQHKREAVSEAYVEHILSELMEQGFCVCHDGLWHIV